MIDDRSLQVLNVLDNHKRKYGKSIFSKPKQEDISEFDTWLNSNLLSRFVSKTKDYLDLMMIANGINFDGLFIYSIIREDDNSIYRSNEIFWENPFNRKYLFFGDDSISWYCLNLEDGGFYVLDKPSGMVQDVVNSFGELLSLAFDSIL